MKPPSIVGWSRALLWWAGRTWVVSLKFETESRIRITITEHEDSFR
jgi:hypothetical protein